MNVLARASIWARCSHIIGKPNERDVIEFTRDAKMIYSQPRAELHRAVERDQLAHRAPARQPGLRRRRIRRACSTQPIPASRPKLSFDPAAGHRRAVPRQRRTSARRDPARAGRQLACRNRLRDAPAGFDAVDVHMSDLIAGRARLDDFKGVIAVGGFSYGDVLGAGEGWAKTILFNAALAEQFAGFFAAHRYLRARRLQRLPDDEQPEVDHPRRRTPGRSSRATSRSSSRRASRMVEVRRLAVDLLRRHGRHAERRSRSRTAKATPTFRRPAISTKRWWRCASSTTAARPREAYPFNPNGSPQGITSVTTPDGRFTVLMPHAERVFRTVQQSWHPDAVGRRFAVDADVPQCPTLGRMSEASRAAYSHDMRLDSEIFWSFFQYTP